MQPRYTTKVIYLIDPSKFEKRKILPQKEFESKNYEFLKFYESLVYVSLDEVNSKILHHFKQGEYDPNLPAVSMVSFLRRGIIRNYPSYCRLATPSRFKLITPENGYLFVKKLDENFMPMNIQTKNNDLILNNCSETEDLNPFIFLGYTTDEMYSKITGVYAVCIADKKIQWRTDISNIDQGTGLLVGINNTLILPKLKDGIVRIKTKTKKE